MRAAPVDPTWLRIRDGDGLRSIRTHIAKYTVNGYEKTTDRLGNAMFKLGYQNHTGAIDWRAFIWLQMWEFAEEAEHRIKQALAIGEQTAPAQGERDG